MEAFVYGITISRWHGGLQRLGDRLWQELIGIVGWQDILLPTWTYVALTVLLILVPFQKLQVSGATRARVAVITGLVVLSYVILVYLIFFLTYTPLDVDHVRGVQGRYFVVVLPVAAIFVEAESGLRHHDSGSIVCLVPKGNVFIWNNPALVQRAADHD